ncbi:glycosyltransferase [Halalkalicoccus tibetensis]|uniref:Glycosyltransferase n=1 Tax=Halalkalicoccus tibetensis TaxID=175632 RepID=A0ABD5V9Q0_9EURY
MRSPPGLVAALGRLGRVNWRAVILFVSALIPFWLLIDVMNDGTLYAIALLGAILVVYIGWSYFVVEHAPRYKELFATRALVVVLLGYGVAIVALGWVAPSILAFVHLLAISLIFFYYWFIALVAVYHDLTGNGTAERPEEYPSISVLVPAYNEEGYVGRAIQSLLDAEYPREKLEIIVVDDGSTDGTLAEARSFASDVVTVVTKENGGKYSALNYGLLFAESEIIVTVDADSIVDHEGLKGIVAPFAEHDNVGAVASNVTIWNRDSLVTRCQQLEYSIGENIYRRMLDQFGIVLVVPGCLGAYRREALEDVFAYDPQTLTEDFDLTLKVLKSGRRVTVSDARVYTEAPGSWRNLYKQRLRWYHGNYMTIFKHWDVVTDPSYGLLHRLAIPFRLVEMFFLPVASWIVLGYIVWLLVTGFAAQVLALLVFFTSIVFLIAALGVQIEGEDWSLLVYAPLLVVGYKQFHDVLNLKCLIDVLGKEELSWTNATRVEQGTERADSGRHLQERT